MASIDHLVATAQRRRAVPPASERRALRQHAGLTQAEIAAALGVARPTVVRWESGERTPRGRLLDEYIKLLDRLAKVVDP